MNNEECTTQELIIFIKNQKKEGQNNNLIIKELINKGCCFSKIFDVLDKTQKGAKTK